MMTHVRHSLLFVALYVASAWFGLTYTSLPPQYLSILWWPSGIAIVGLVAMGWRALPLVFLANSLVNWPELLDLSTSLRFINTIGHALTSSSLDTLQPAIGAWMYSRVCKHGCMFNDKSFLMFLAGVVLLPALSTGWALVLNFHVGGYVLYESRAALFTGMINTTVSDAMSIFVLVPIYDALVGMHDRKIHIREYVEFLLLIALLFGFLYLVLVQPVLRPVLILIPLSGLALRNGVVGSSVGFFLSAIILIVSTVNDLGPFTLGEFETDFLSLMSFLLALGLPIHLIAINILNSKRLAETLEHRVEQRTAELREKEVRLTELNHDKDKLMSIIGHDLRNPIQGIIGLGELVVADARDKQYDEVQSYGRMIQGSARQTLQLLQNLMDWSATQSGRMRFNPQPIDISRLIGEALDVVAEMAKSKSITLQVDVEMGLTANVDKQMMATILRNLVSNSLKFTPAGGTILTSAHSTENGFTLSVADTGVGMTDIQVDALFGPSTNTSTQGTEGERGTGLGLLLVHEFAQKHQAKITVDSEPGRGTTFQLEFPKLS